MIRERKDAVLRLHAEHAKTEPTSVESNGHRLFGAVALDDDEIIQCYRSAKNAPKFERLFDRGDLSKYDGDHSRADQALVSMLAFYTQDEGQLDRLFRAPALYRPEKWGKRPDYRRRTIRKALSDLSETYAPASGVNVNPGKNWLKT